MATVLDDCPGLRSFLEKESAATLAVPVDEQGTIHVAALLYWHDPDSFVFYFVTGKHTEKCSLLGDKKTLQGGLVVGTSKGTPFTLQMRGNISLLDKGEHRAVLDNYYQKRGNRHDDINDPDNVLLMFAPTWARYTDYADGYKRRFISLSKEAASE